MKKFFFLIPLAILFGVIIGFYLYNKSPKEIKTSKADVTISAPTLFKEFEQNEEAANLKYLDKVIEVKGEIKEISQGDSITDMILEAENESFGVLCTFDKPTPKANLKKGDPVNVKGLCTGMLTDVVLIKCSLNEKSK